MTSKGLIIAVISVGVGLGALLLNGQRTSSRDIANLRSEVAALRTEILDDIAGLRERMARLEGLFEGFTKREAVR